MRRRCMSLLILLLAAVSTADHHGEPWRYAYASEGSSLSSGVDGHLRTGLYAASAKARKPTDHPKTHEALHATT